MKRIYSAGDGCPGACARRVSRVFANRSGTSAPENDGRDKVAMDVGAAPARRASSRR